MKNQIPFEYILKNKKENKNNIKNITLIKNNMLINN